MQHSKWIASVALGLQLMAACAVLVDPEALLIRCEFDPLTETRDPCQPLGQQCIDGMCRACDSEARELCNGRDDDCDGEIDEGHDTDEDGFTWCGGGRVELADCVDRDKAIHPGEGGMPERAPEEVCDGKDNDCDTRVDEDRDCNRGRTCVETGCPENQRCDAGSGVCIVPREVGSGCSLDSDCKGGFCLRPNAFGLPVNLMDNRCASACCSNSDCDEGSSCVIAASGARACLPANIVSRGSRQVGVRCSRDTDCASGLCAGGQCVARCFNDENCPSEDEECALSEGSTSAPRIFLCGEPGGRAADGDMCPLAGCRSNYCTDEFLCGRPCSRDSDCTMNYYCAFADVRAGLIGPLSSISICVRRPADSAGAEGIERLCCSNDDCGDNELCAPNAARNMSWHMSCRSK